MNLGVGNWSMETTSLVMDDKGNLNSRDNDFKLFEYLENHQKSRDSKIPRVVGDGRLGYHCAHLSLTSVVMPIVIVFLQLKRSQGNKHKERP